jgi:hypothetical protein
VGERNKLTLGAMMNMLGDILETIAHAPIVREEA